MSTETSTRFMRYAVVSAVCIALNIGLNKIAAVLVLPVFMDTVGTLLAAALVPPPYAIAVGVISNLIGGVITHPSIPFYIGTQVVISLMAIAAVRRGLFSRLSTSMLAGLAIGIVSAVVSAPVTVVMFGGVTEPGATALNAILMAAGKDIWTSVISGLIVVSSVDKIIAAVIVWMLLRRLPREFTEARS